MSNDEIPQSVREEIAYANGLISFITDQASGRATDECIGEMPRNLYFIGSIRPEPLEQEAQRWLRDLAEKLAPVAIGVEVGLHTAGQSMEIAATASWSVYYRVRPSYKEQIEFQNPSGAAEEEATEEDTSSDTNIPPTQPRRPTRERLKPRFRKILCTASGTIRVSRGPSAAQIDAASLQSAIDSELDRARSLILNDPLALRTGRQQQDKPDRLVQTDMASEASYSAFWQGLTFVPQTPWELNVIAEARVSPETTNDIVLITDLANQTKISDRDEVHEPFIFEVQLAMELPPDVVRPFYLLTAPKDFREDPRMFGRGRNCGATFKNGVLSTTHTPMYEQGRYRARATPEAKVRDLVTEPIPTLATILGGMKDYLREWDSALVNYRSMPWWDSNKEAAFDKDRKTYIDEITRFEDGLRLLQGSDDVLHAFRLTQKAFELNAPGMKWRLMQIVFLVCQLRGLTGDSEAEVERDIVDIVYFPTGGGKTEAYLACVTFSCFWDRLRGKAAGVTAWARFPLRLLSVQQLQRFTNIIASADLVRRGDPDVRLSGKNVDHFAVGYYVGQGVTPNSIAGENTSRSGLPWAQATDDDFIQRFKRITYCPVCRDASGSRNMPIRVVFDRDRVSLLHRCQNPECPFPDGLLPVYVVDNDIYRYLPSVMVGTIDKLAQLGVARKFSMILGRVDGRCPKHGYYNGKCCQDDVCRERLVTGGLPPGLSGPSLFVQDELHLLREGLGTYDGHYETIFQEMIRLAGSCQPIKIIASSATIEKFEVQVEHLYCRSRSRVFPGYGPVRGESFYAQTFPYPQRVFVGVMPRNKTLLRALIELGEYFFRCATDAKSREPQMAKLYNAMATYFLANRELDAFERDLKDYVSPRLTAANLPVPAISALTGNTLADEVSNILRTLENAPAASDPPEAVLATYTISHGVDIDRLNVMFFFGMPRSTSEYIQASSRVGRAHVGVVFTCFNPSREREQSHYHYFAKHHEFLGRLVEPVPVNRWSKFSLERTLPGALVATLYHDYGASLPVARRNDVSFVDRVKQMLSTEAVTFSRLENTVCASYGLDGANDPIRLSFRQRLSQRLRQLVRDQIETNARPVQWLSEALAPPPMRSLREVDDPVSIRLDYAGQAWGRQNGRRSEGGDGSGGR